MPQELQPPQPPKVSAAKTPRQAGKNKVQEAVPPVTHDKSIARERARLGVEGYISIYEEPLNATRPSLTVKTQFGGPVGPIQELSLVPAQAPAPLSKPAAPKQKATPKAKAAPKKKAPKPKPKQAPKLTSLNPQPQEEAPTVQDFLLTPKSSNPPTASHSNPAPPPPHQKP